MIQLDEPRTADPAPARRNLAVGGLVVVGALVVASGPVPWERYCVYSNTGLARLCFHAGLWSGSASLYGFATAVLAAIFVPLALVRRWTASGRLPLPGVALFAAFLATLAVKVTVVFVDAAQTSANQDGARPAAFGVWIGDVMLFVGVLMLLVALYGGPAPRRPLAVGALVCLILGALAVPYVRSGLAWWGGPLAPPRFLGGGNGMGLQASPGEPAFFDGLLLVENGGHVSARLDGLELVDVAPPFWVRSTFVNAHCMSDFLTVSNFAQCAGSLDGWVMNPGPANSRYLGVEFQVPDVGTYRVGWFRIDYHVGPFRFEVFRTDQLVVCAPAPGHERCPGSGIG